MRKILIFILVLVSVQSFGQNPGNYTWINGKYRWQSGMFDSTFRLPRYNGVPSGLRNGEWSTMDGALAADTANGNVYYYWNTVWNRLALYTDISAGTVNIYNSNGILTGNRTLTGLNDTYNLTFDSLNQFSTGRAGITRIYHNSSGSGLYSPNGTNHNYVTNAFAGFNINSGANYFLTLQDSSKTAKKISYEGNLHGLFNAYTLVDKSYVDSVTGAVSSTADGYSVLGRTGSTSGSAVSITASNNEDVLFKNANVLQFGQPNLLKNQGNTIGDIFVKSTMGDTVGVTAYTDGNTTYSFNANRLRVQTTPATSDVLGGRVIVDSFRTGLDKITVEVDIEYNATGGQRYSAPIGIYNYNTGRYICVGILWTAAGSPIGTVGVYTGDHLLSGGTSSTASSLLSFSVGDVIAHKFEAFENTVYYSVRNKTTGSAWITAVLTLKNTETKYSSGWVTIGWGFDADYYINSIKVSSKEIKNPDVYLLGDSKFTKSTYQNESFVSRLKNNYGVVVANSDPGGVSSDAVDQLELIIDYIKPKKVLYANSNDERNSIPNATWQAQYDTIYNRLTRYGIDVYFTSFPETGASQADVNTFLAANYSSVYIQRPYTVLSGLNTSDYLLGDGIHLTAQGNKIAFDETILDGKLNGNTKDWYKDVGTITPGNESGYGVIYNRADSLRFKNDAGTEFTLGASVAGSSSWNAITSPTGDQALTFQVGESSTWTDENTTEDLLTINDAASSTKSIVSINRTSTALTTGNNIMELNSSGANVVGSTTANGLVVSVTNTGTGSANRAGKFTASGAASLNVAIEAVGRVGINEPDPQTQLQVGHASTTSGFGTGAQMIFSNSGSSTYISGVGPSGSEAFFGAESAKGVFGMLTNDALEIRTNNTTRSVYAANGAFKLNPYGAGSFTGTPARYLAVESDGDVIEATASSLKPALNKAVTIEAPSSSEAIDMWQTPVAITVTSLKAILRGSSPSVTYNIRFGTDITSSTDVFTADITCTSTTTGCSNSSGFNDATIPAGSFIWVITSAMSGTVTSISLTLNYTED